MSRDGRDSGGKVSVLFAIDRPPLTKQPRITENIRGSKLRLLTNTGSVIRTRKPKFQPSVLTVEPKPEEP
jgi:hypothetical protein